MNYDYIMKLLIILYYISEKHRVNCDNQKRTKACEMLIAIDEPLYDLFNGNIQNLTKMAKDHVEELNKLFHKSVFDGKKYENIYFRIKEIRFLFEFCEECLSKDNPQDVFLKEFSKMNTSEYCLAHIFTYRDFPGRYAGLASFKGICNKENNTAFTTYLVDNVRSINIFQEKNERVTLVKR